MVGSNDRKCAANIPVINELKELFFGPGSGLLRAKVVQDQNVHLSHQGVQRVRGDLRGWGICCTKMIQQIWNSGEEDRSITLQQDVGSGCREVGFPTPIRSNQE